MIFIDADVSITAKFSRKEDNPSHEATTDNGIPAGLPGRQTEHSKRLERIIDNELQRTGQPTGFKALAIGSNSLPDPLRRALAGFERVTGTQVVIFRNLMSTLSR